MAYLSMNVDDAGQFAEGDERKVAKWPAQGAVAFVRMARSLDLQLSVSNPATGSKGKIRLVYNNRLACRAVAHHLAYAWGACAD